jgi:ketosteroid isomerase-like protein
VHAQAADPTADKAAVDKMIHDHFEAYSRGDLAAVMNFINVPGGPKGLV